MQDQRASRWFYVSLESHGPRGWHKWPWAWEHSKTGVCLFYSKTRFVFPRAAWWQVALWAPRGPCLCLGGASSGTGTVSRQAWPCHAATSASFSQTPRKQTPFCYWKAKTTVFSLLFFSFLFPVSISKRGSQSSGPDFGTKTMGSLGNSLSQANLIRETRICLANISMKVSRLPKT